MALYLKRGACGVGASSNKGFPMKETFAREVAKQDPLRLFVPCFFSAFPFGSLWCLWPPMSLSFAECPFRLRCPFLPGPHFPHMPMTAMLDFRGAVDNLSRPNPPSPRACPRCLCHGQISSHGVNSTRRLACQITVEQLCRSSGIYLETSSIYVLFQGKGQNAHLPWKQRK